MFVKKLASLSFALALVYSISLPARAELLKNFKTDGSIEVKTFGIDNETDRNGTADDYRSETRSRILLGGSFDLLDDVHSRILLRKNNHLQGQAVESVQTVESAVAIDNGYVKIDKVFGHVDLTIGRQFYGDSNDLLIYFGLQPDDLLSVTSLDVFRADADIMGWAKFQGIAGKTAETTAVSATPTPPAATNANSDTDIWGGELSTDKLIPKGNLGVGYYTLQAKGAGVIGNNTLNNVSIKANGDVPVLSGLGYAAQYVQNFGRNNAVGGTPSHRGDAYILGLNANHDFGKMPLRAHAEYGRGSDDFVSIAPGKRFGIIWGEHTNAAGAPSLNGSVGGAGLTNLRVFDLGAGTNCPITHVGIDLNWYRFIYDESLATVPNAGKTSAGSELDLILSHKHSENVSLEASLARFWVGDALQNAATPTNPVTRIGADVKIKF